MTGKFHIGGKDFAQEPYVYRISGLDDVVLLNGFSREATDYGEGVAIENVDNLHRAIALHIVSTKKALNPREFRFLRREMEMTQNELSSALGVDGQTVARYEKGQTGITGPVDRLLRFLFVFNLLPKDMQAEVIERAREAIERDEVTEHSPSFIEEEGSWFEACA
ncbi:helix-turn-helix domain-containing protein [Aliiroseovarius sp.]|uniref:helix-turn-helix domain-containing protein n=1 Tax=Aliiroseovarius sp. TaxID=1872442 RepID=UPI003BABBA8D